MLGTEISRLLEKNNITFAGTDSEVDICDPSALMSFANKQSKPITWIINCAAYTAVDKAEDDIENCRNLNTRGAANIAVLAKNIGAKLIHISTDYVFNGLANKPYTEEDDTDPIGIYGLTKRDGEIAVLEHNPNSYIIRTAWLYGEYGNNFVHTMLKLMNERDELKIVDDQRGSPTWSYDLAFTILSMIQNATSGKNIPFGIYHFTNEGNITWFDFSKEIYKQGRENGRINKDCVLKPCTSVEYPSRVKRPFYSVLDKNKIKTSGISVPTWDISLNNYLKQGIYE